MASEQTHHRPRGGRQHGSVSISSPARRFGWGLLSSKSNVKSMDSPGRKPKSHAQTTTSNRARYGSDSSDAESSSSVIDDWSSDSDGSNSDTESLTGFPFHLTSIQESIAETLNEDAPSIYSSGRQGLVVLQSSSDKEVFNIESSRYCDDSNSFGSNSDELSAELFNAVSSTSKTQPIFRWIHMKQDAIDFGTFARTVKELPGLTDQDNREIKKLLQRVQKVAIKPFRTRHGPQGRLMEPIVNAKAVENHDLDTRDDYLFFSMPYFQLEKYIQSNLPDHSHLHLARPLIQSQYISTSMQRELRQAVCRLPGARPDHCFHIEVFWCLIIRDKYMVSYSRQLSASELHGDRIEIRNSPTLEPPGTTNGNQAVLQVVDTNVLFLVPLAQCQSWFKFIQLYSEITLDFDAYASVFWRGRKIDSAHWATVIKQAQRQPTRIFVTWRARPVLRRLETSIVDLDDNEISSQVGDSRPTTPVKDSQSHASPHASPPPTIRSSDTLGTSPKGTDGRDLSVPHHRFTASLEEHLQAPKLVGRTSSRSPMSVYDYLREFHVLKWVAIRRVNFSPDIEQAVSDKSTPRISLQTSELRGSLDDKVRDYLQELHKYMDAHQDPIIRRPYRKCATKSLKEAEQALIGMAKGKLDSSEVIDMKKKFLTAAKTIFLLFLPRDQKGPIPSKYWGAVHAIITGSMKSNDKIAHKIIAKLTVIAKLAITMQGQLSRGKGPDPLEARLPPEFVKAWVHVFTCLINWRPETISVALKQARKCEHTISKAYRLVLQNIDGKALVELRAVLPSELLVFLAKRLLDGVAGEQGTIIETYWAYYNQLVMQIRNDPLNRSHQGEISGLVDEMDIVNQHLEQQRVVLEKLSGYDAYEAADPDFEEQGHIRLLRDAINNVRTMRHSLVDLRRRTQSLAGQSKEHIENNKQRQEAAIYVFTIVTIIFLPISTVSSIFGMNTQDIRDLEYGQWIFWAVVIPVTVVVVVAALFGAGVLSFNGKFGSWGGTQKGNVMTPGFEFAPPISPRGTRPLAPPPVALPHVRFMPPPPPGR
ncbi:cora-like Mg2+ transporter protein-domain-containing protein [Xylaria longipes]|nr:cora-like Mg2+ transporter protein-domain-containing protein [Xylaria longipes]